MNEVVGLEIVDPGEAELRSNGAGEPRGRRLERSTVSDLQPLRAAKRLALGLGNLLPHLCFNRVRTAFWRAARMQIGEGSLIMGDVLLSGTGDWSSLMSIGKYTYITGPLRINLGGTVRIGNSVNVGHDCIFLTVDHELGPSYRRAGFSTHGDITIGDGVWIASRVTILPGVSVGDGAVVAAGAVVASDVAPNTMVAGVPAKLLRKLATP